MEWFAEKGNGIGLMFEVVECLCDLQTEFQHLQIFQTSRNGRLMVLDGIIQLLESDEFVYHEMMVNLPVMAHPAPKRALVIGGGDGGSVRELVRHADIERIDWCDIDAEVVEACRRHLPSTSAAAADPRVHLTIGDGARFVRECADCYDVVIVDSTDPGGVAEPLFGEAFYRDVRRALRPGGIVSSQSESVFLFPETARRLYRNTLASFAVSHYAMYYVPSYPTGMIGACVAGRDGEVTAPVRQAPTELAAQWRYYSPEIHRAAFVLPPFAREQIEKKD